MEVQIISGERKVMGVGGVGVRVEFGDEKACDSCFWIEGDWIPTGGEGFGKIVGVEVIGMTTDTPPPVAGDLHLVEMGSQLW